MAAMKKENYEHLSQSVDESKAREEHMLKRLLERAKDFYQKPEHIQSLNKWLAERERKDNEV
jgi:hypothetical protein